MLGLPGASRVIKYYIFIRICVHDVYIYILILCDACTYHSNYRIDGYYDKKLKIKITKNKKRVAVVNGGKYCIVYDDKHHVHSV